MAERFLIIISAVGRYFISMDLTLTYNFEGESTNAEDVGRRQKEMTSMQKLCVIKLKGKKILNTLFCTPFGWGKEKDYALKLLCFLSPQNGCT